MDDYEPYYAFRWVVTLPRQDPLIADRRCMSRVPWRQRLARQIWPPTGTATAAGTTASTGGRRQSQRAIARQIERGGIMGEEKMDDRAFDLIQAVGL